MKTIKSFAMLLIILCFNQAHAQSDLKELSYHAYLKSALPLWGKAVDQQKKVVNDQSDKAAKLELSLLYYGYLGATMATQDEDAFDERISDAVDYTEKLIEDYPKWGEPKAILSSIMGLQMAYSPFKGAVLGMKSGSYMSKAMKESPDSPIVMKLYAGSKQYTPALWGGDKKVALTYYQKVIAKYEQEEKTTNNWLYADALANAGIVLSDLGKKKEAKEVFEKALAFEPDFMWVKKGLLPKVENVD